MTRTTFVCCLLLFSTSLEAGNWAQFRGPHFNGSTGETGLPARWSATENVVWVADLPGSSASTPIIWSDRVFVSSTDEDQDTLCAICLDRSTGKVLWRRDVAQGIRRDSRSTFAAPTPATDGERVIFFYGNGDLVAFDFQGDQLWKRNLQADYGEFAFLWTFSSSPVLYDGKLFLQVLQRDTPVDGRGFEDRFNESYLLALNPETGEELWRRVRHSNAVQESREAFTTPVPFDYEGRRELLVAGGDALTGHDPESGEELWRWGTWNPRRIGHWRLVPSPVAGRGVILACAPKGDPIYAIQAGGDGDLSQAHVVWTSGDDRKLTADVPTPAFADGDFFVLGDVARQLSRIDPRTGSVKWTARLPGRDKYEASPLAADGKVYVVDFSSRVSVFDMETGEQLGETVMEERLGRDVVRSSIVAAQGHLFIRAGKKLYCIDEPVGN